MLKYISLQNFMTTILTKRKLNFWNYIVIIWPGVIYEIKVWWTNQLYKTKNNLLVLSVHFFFCHTDVLSYSSWNVLLSHLNGDQMLSVWWAHSEHTLNGICWAFMNGEWWAKAERKWRAKWMVNAPWTICEPIVNARWTIYLEYLGSYPYIVFCQ